MHVSLKSKRDTRNLANNKRMVFLIADTHSQSLLQKLRPEANAYPSDEQALEAAFRSNSPVMAISISGNTFQIAANKYYEEMKAASIRSFEDVNEAVRFGVRLFEIPGNIGKNKAKALLGYIGERIQ